MKTTYKNPEISVIELDRAISLHMHTHMQTVTPTTEVAEPDNGGAGLGGEGNGESGWERASQGINAITPSVLQQQNQMPQND
ncbi:MAG: hypothetical protein LBN23_08420 [Paludibacter sp.]|nr:hypothetical protein [Paludibacter sp.]